MTGYSLWCTMIVVVIASFFCVDNWQSIKLKKDVMKFSWILFFDSYHYFVLIYSVVISIFFLFTVVKFLMYFEKILLISNTLWLLVLWCWQLINVTITKTWTCWCCHESSPKYVSPFIISSYTYWFFLVDLLVASLVYLRLPTVPRYVKLCLLEVPHNVTHHFLIDFLLLFI